MKNKWPITGEIARLGGRFGGYTRFLSIMNDSGKCQVCPPPSLKIVPAPLHCHAYSFEILEFRKVLGKMSKIEQAIKLKSRVFRNLVFVKKSIFEIKYNINPQLSKHLKKHARSNRYIICLSISVTYLRCRWFNIC